MNWKREDIVPGMLVMKNPVCATDKPDIYKIVFSPPGNYYLISLANINWGNVDLQGKYSLAIDVLEDVLTDGYSICEYEYIIQPRDKKIQTDGVWIHFKSKLFNEGMSLGGPYYCAYSKQKLSNGDEICLVTNGSKLYPDCYVLKSVCDEHGISAVSTTLLQRWLEFQSLYRIKFI